MNRLLVAALAFAGITMAQPVPAGWKVMKSQKGTCQISVPNNWTFDTDLGNALDPQKLYTAMILHAVDAKMDAEAYRLVGYNPIKVFENSSKRVILEDKVRSFSRMPPPEDGRPGSTVDQGRLPGNGDIQGRRIGRTCQADRADGFDIALIRRYSRRPNRSAGGYAQTSRWRRSSRWASGMARTSSNPGLHAGYVTRPADHERDGRVVDRAGQAGVGLALTSMRRNSSS